MAILTLHRKDLTLKDFWVLDQIRRAVLRRAIPIWQFDVAYSRSMYAEPFHLFPRWEVRGSFFRFHDLVQREQAHIALSRALFRRLCKNVLKEPIGEVVSRLYKMNMLAVHTGAEDPGKYVFDGHLESWIQDALWPGREFFEEGGEMKLGTYIILEARRFEKGFGRSDRDRPSPKQRRLA